MSQKTVLITGCSEGGIGDALAKSFHKKGIRVIATARDLKKVEHLRVLGIEDIIPLDVVDEDSIKSALESVTKLTNGKLDFLVNNSGAGYSMPLLDAETPIAQNLFNLNVFAPIRITQAFSPLLIATKGTIINIGSVAGFAPIYWQGYYNASKAAVNILTDQLRLELAPFDVTVILVLAGGVKTKFSANLPTVTLPETSVYAPAKENIEFALKGGVVEGSRVDVDVFAEKVVKNALKKRPETHLVLGGSATLLWVLATFLWHTIWDTVFAHFWKVGEVTKKIKAAGNKQG